MREEEFDHIEAMPRLFLDHLGVGISLVDVDEGRIVFANQECARIFGFSQQELTRGDLKFIDLTHPEDRERNLLEHRRMLQGEIEQYRIEKRYLRRDGTIIWANVAVSAIKNNKGVIRWCCAAIEDITDKRRIEQQLALAQRVSGLATWNFAVGTSRSETSSGYNFVFGVADAVPAPSLDDLIQRVHPEDRQSVMTTIQRAIATGVGYTQEYRIVADNGDVRWLRGIANCMLNAAGEVTNLIGATIDITDSRARSLRRPPKPLSDMLDHIEKNWNTPLSIDKLAAHFGCSSRQVFRHFAAEGTSAIAQIKQVRLRHARQLLSKPTRDTTVVDVAVACCFQNMGHFARDYRRQFGELPSETLKVGRDGGSGQLARAAIPGIRP